MDVNRQDHLFPVATFIIFFIFTAMELAGFSNVDPYADTTVPEKEIPELKSGIAAGPGNEMKDVLSISYCHSCGYHKAFMEYSNMLSAKYPDLIIEGLYHQPAAFFFILSKLLTAIKMLLIVLIVMKKNLFALFGMMQPPWWTWCLENKFFSVMLIFFLSNMFENMLISTGAFEFTYNGIPIWSKLQTGRIPQPYELFEIINNQKISSGKFEYIQSQ